jgi:hypothetical protein
VQLAPLFGQVRFELAQKRLAIRAWLPLAGLFVLAVSPAHPARP